MKSSLKEQGSAFCRHLIKRLITRHKSLSFLEKKPPPPQKKRSVSQGTLHNNIKLVRIVLILIKMFCLTYKTEGRVGVFPGTI